MGRVLRITGLYLLWTDSKGFPAACVPWATLLLFTVPSEKGLCNTAQWQPDVAVVTDAGVISTFACLSFGSYWLNRVYIFPLYAAITLRQLQAVLPSD